MKTRPPRNLTERQETKFPPQRHDLKGTFHLNPGEPTFPASGYALLPATSGDLGG